MTDIRTRLDQQENKLEVLNQVLYKQSSDLQAFKEVENKRLDQQDIWLDMLSNALDMQAARIQQLEQEQGLEIDDCDNLPDHDDLFTLNINFLRR